MMPGFVLKSVAKYSQRCSACRKRIRVGSFIERHGKRWCHAVCPLRSDPYNGNRNHTRAPAYTSFEPLHEGGNQPTGPVCIEVETLSPGPLWLMAQGVCPPTLVSMNQLLGRAHVGGEKEPTLSMCADLFDRIRRASYDDSSIQRAKRPRWRRNLLNRN